VLEYYETVARVIGWHGTFTFDPSKPAGMRRKVVDVSRQSQWGWKPTTSLESGIRQTYDFFLRNHANER
jgi:GDP-L-fucose synthase